MNFKVLGWVGFGFLAAGVMLYVWGALYKHPEVKPFGCGAILTALSLYAVGLILIVRMIRRTKRGVEQMMRRVLDEAERRNRESSDRRDPS